MKCLLSVGGVSRRGVHKIGWFLMGRACKVCVLGTGGGSDEACLAGRGKKYESWLLGRDSM